MEEGSRKVQYWVAFAVGLASMTASASFSWTISVIPKFHNNETDIRITDTEISWLVMAVVPGMIVGNIATQYQSDIFGRRTALLASAIPFCIGTMFVLLATKVWAFYVARFLWGVGAGITKSVATIYIAEIASKEIRGSLVVGNRFMFNFGNLLIVAIGICVSYQTLSFLLLVMPATFFIACWWISETPYYLLKENKVDAARKELMKLNGYKDQMILEQKLTEMRAHVQEDMRRSTTVKELFTGKQYRKALIICFGIRLFHTMSGTILIQQYVGRLMQDTESSISVSTGLILFSTLKFIASMMSSGIVDRVGRRPLLIYSHIGVFLSFAVVGTCFFVHEIIVIEKYSKLCGNVIFFGLICSSIISTVGYDTLINVIPAEIFPLNVKSIAMTFINLLGSLLALVSIGGYQILKDFTGLYVVFWFFGTTSFFGAVFSYCVVTETKGKSLREVQIELQGSLYDVGVENEDATKTKDGEIKLIVNGAPQVNIKLNSND